MIIWCLLKSVCNAEIPADATAHGKIKGQFKRQSIELPGKKNL